MLLPYISCVGNNENQFYRLVIDGKTYSRYKVSTDLIFDLVEVAMKSESLYSYQDWHAENVIRLLFQKCV